MIATLQGLATGLALTALLLAPPAADAAAPVLYSSPANESPVRGDPNDLLFLPGYGFAATDTIVYQSVTDTTAPLVHPVAIPSTSTVTCGTAPLVSTTSVPYSLTVQLPAVMHTGQSYALWVVNSSNEWSGGIEINDARPLWVTPDNAYVTAALPALPRTIKVVGRNLQHAPGMQTRVRLAEPATYTLFAADDNDPVTAIERYVAAVDLPASMAGGRYSIEVSRDGSSWVPLVGQKLVVNPDPGVPAQFSIGAAAYGGCAADDNNDDTGCLVQAIAAARANGGGTVTLGAGHWILGNASAAGVGADGILLPPGVNLSGAGAEATFVQRGAAWTPAVPTFTAQGNNIIQGFNFTDARLYTGSSATAPFLKLGVDWQRYNRYNPTDPNYLSNVTITHNTFDKPYMAIGDGSLPMDHLYITYNDFGAFAEGLRLNANGFNVQQRLRIEDSVIAFNTFEPGSYLNPTQAQGVIASELAGGHRLDFSDNVSDGTSTAYLNDPVDPKGWRAAHFWNTGGGSHEEVLVSRNFASCTGDKIGDGEFIETDAAGLQLGLPVPQTASAATLNTVTIAGPVVNGVPGSYTVPGNYFFGYWVAVLDGPGRGQVRKIVSYPLDSSGAAVLPVTFTVAPAWDVIPLETSRIAVVTEYWQMYVVDNTVDQTQPTCTKGNIIKPAGGIIGFYGASYADGAIEGNTQSDTDGIRVTVQYIEQDAVLGYSPRIAFASGLEIRGNTINGEYDYASTCSWGGIELWNSAGQTAGSSPPALALGVAISHNAIAHADGYTGGAIDLTRGWYGGPPPGPWDLTQGVAVFNNAISDVSGSPTTVVSGPLPYATSPYKSCNTDSRPRRGVGVNDSSVWNTVLTGNTCTNVANNLFDAGLATQRICSAATVNGCECPVSPVAYWRFDEGSGTGTADAAGGSNSGTLLDGAVWTAGKTGGALNFAAAASYLSISNSGALNDLYRSGQGMTVTAWINPASAGGGGGGRIIDKDNNNRGWLLAMNPGAASLQFRADQFATAPAIRNSAPNTIGLNQWQHVAVTWAGTTDASKIHFYINGTLADDPSLPTNGVGTAQSDAGSPFTIGNRPQDQAFNFDGSIDAVRVYNRVLTPAEIQSLVNGGS